MALPGTHQLAAKFIDSESLLLKARHGQRPPGLLR